MLLPGFLSPRGRRRKFIALCAYGAFHYYSAVGPAEQEWLTQELEVVPGSRLGGLDIEAVAEAAADRRAFLAEQLPPLAPDDLLLVERARSSTSSRKRWQGCRLDGTGAVTAARKR